MSNRKVKRLMAKKQAEVELAKMAKTQLSRLQRQYKVMEGSRLTYEEEMNILLQKQRNQLALLKEEKENVDADGKLCVATTFIAKDKHFQSRLVQLIKEKEKYEEKVKDAKVKLLETNSELLKADNELLRLRGEHAKEERKIGNLLKDAGRQLQLLESKLAIATKELNKVMSNNSLLREEIDNLLKERARFKDLLDSCLGSLHEGKSHMLNMIEQATVAYEHREEAQTKLHMLENRSLLVQEMHSQQIRDLDRLLYHDIERINFLTIKGQHRVMHQLKAKRDLKEQLQARKVEEQMDEYKKILNQLFQYFQEDNVDNICALYKMQEEENLALFNYVNEVNSEAESLHDQAKTLKQKIDEQRKIKMDKISQQEDDISQLEKKAEAAASRADSVIAKRDFLSTVLNTLLVRSNRLFRLAGCDASPLANLMGDYERVNANSLDVMLAILEKKLQTLLHRVFFVEQKLPEDQLKLKRFIYNRKLPPRRKKPRPKKKMRDIAPCPICLEHDRLKTKKRFTDATATSEELLQEMLRPEEVAKWGKLLHPVSECHRLESRNILRGGTFGQE